MLARFHAWSLPRVVIVALGLLVLAAGIAAVSGGLDPSIFTPGAMAASLVVVLLASWGSSVVLGRVVGSQPSMESATITALVLWFLVWPTSSVTGLLGLAVLAALAQATKYLVAVRRRHLVNPAAAGLVLGWCVNAVVGSAVLPVSTWWIASESLVWPVVVTGVLVLWRTGRPVAPFFFVLPAGVWASQALVGIGFSATLLDAVRLVLVSTPLLFLAFFLLTEPLTLPPGRVGQAVAGVAAAVVFAAPWAAGDLGFSLPDVAYALPGELALVASGIVAFVYGQGGARLRLVERRPLGADAVEYTFSSRRPVRFRPGQYVELDLAHPHPDARGRRRAFSPVRVDGDRIVIATRHVEPASSFKRALADLPVEGSARLTAVHGDFVWPRRGPVLLVGAGIGVTPFLTQLRADPDRDVVLVVGVRDDEQPYLDDLVALAPRAVVLPVQEVTVARIRAEVPDVAARTVLVSGRPDFVAPIAYGLTRLFRPVRTDHFWGV